MYAHQPHCSWFLVVCDVSALVWWNGGGFFWPQCHALNAFWSNDVAAPPSPGLMLIIR